MAGDAGCGGLCNEYSCLIGLINFTIKLLHSCQRGGWAISGWAKPIILPRDNLTINSRNNLILLGNVLVVGIVGGLVVSVAVGVDTLIDLVANSARNVDGDLPDQSGTTDMKRQLLRAC